jgi:hypothetical protein
MLLKHCVLFCEQISYLSTVTGKLECFSSFVSSLSCTTTDFKSSAICLIVVEHSLRSTLNVSAWNLLKFGKTKSTMIGCCLGRVIMYSKPSKISEYILVSPSFSIIFIITCREFLDLARLFVRGELKYVFLHVETYL